jgi:hypothetical protein
MELKRQLIMNIDKTQNDFEITKEMVFNSMESFINKPIVYNKKQEFKDYSEDNLSIYKDRTIVIGIIIGNIEVTDTEVLADIMIRDDFKDLWKGKYDNWCIDYPVDNDKNKFEFLSVEVF